MKTTSVIDLPHGVSAILKWLDEGETVLLVSKEGRPIGRIVPEESLEQEDHGPLADVFAKRFAPLDSIPDRDLSSIVAENRGER